MSDIPIPADTLIQDQANIFASAVGSSVLKDKSYALLDYPDYNNIGDSAIYSGELKFFDMYVGRRPHTVCTCDASMQWLAKNLPAEGTIFMHGGGNFGDIWMRHQNFRHNVLRDFPDRKVVQLPQSIHYRDPAGISETARLIANHRDFTLFVRDQHSLDLAKRHFDCETILCPDAAMMLHRINIDIEPQTNFLVALRDDAEAVQDEIHDWLRHHYTTADWINVDVWTLPIRVVWKLVRSMPDNRLGMIWREAMYRHQANARVIAGARQLALGRLIITDRLHMHIISTLIRRPHIVLDNSYGKISRYIDAFGRDDLTIRASNLKELQDIIKNHLVGI